MPCILVLTEPIIFILTSIVLLALVVIRVTFHPIQPVLLVYLTCCNNI